MKITEKALMNAMCEALIEAERLLRQSRDALAGEGTVPDLVRVDQSLARTNRIIGYALKQLRECELA